MMHVRLRLTRPGADASLSLSRPRDLCSIRHRRSQGSFRLARILLVLCSSEERCRWLGVLTKWT